MAKSLLTLCMTNLMNPTWALHHSTGTSRLLLLNSSTTASSIQQIQKTSQQVVIVNATTSREQASLAPSSRERNSTLEASDWKVTWIWWRRALLGHLAAAGEAVEVVCLDAIVCTKNRPFFFVCLFNFYGLVEIILCFCVYFCWTSQYKSDRSTLFFSP